MGEGEEKMFGGEGGGGREEGDPSVGLWGDRSLLFLEALKTFFKRGRDR